MRCLAQLSFVASVFGAAFALSASASWAQTGSQQPPLPSPQDSAPAPLPSFRIEIIVTAERAPGDRDRQPAATAVVTRDQIDQQPAVTLADVASTLPGFQILSAGSSGFPPSSIARGFFGGGEAEYVKVLVDGMPIGDVESGVVDWRGLPALAIDRIEALRGPASAAYGDAALAGAIQVFTLRSSVPVRRATVSGGSFGAVLAGAEVGQSVGRVMLRGVGSYTRSDGFRARSDIRESFASLSAHRPTESGEWSLRASFSGAARDEPGPLSTLQLSTDRNMSDASFRFDRENTRRASVAVRFGEAKSAWTYSLLAYAGGRDGARLRTLLLAPGVGDSAERETSSHTIGTSVENSVETNVGPVSGHLRFGADAGIDELDTSYRPMSATGSSGGDVASLGGRRTQVAGYATYAVNVGDRSTVHGGIRWDRLRDDAGDAGQMSHQAWSPRFGATVGLGRGVVLFGQASRAFKAPTLDQLFDPRPFPDFRGGTFLISSPTLRPQRAHNIEGGLRQSFRSHRWEAVIYRLKVRDEIDFDPASFTYANIGQSTHEGLELDVALFRGSPVSVGANYAWTRVAPDPADAGTQLKNIPRHLLRPNVTVRLAKDIVVYTAYTRTAGAYADDANTFRLRDRSTVDMRITKRIQRLTARVDLLNMTNDQYEEVGYVLSDFRGALAPYYYPGPGFAARGGVDVSF